MNWAKVLGQFAKGAFAGVFSFLSALTTVLVGDMGFGDLTAGQWLTATVFALGIAGGVWGIPYVPSKKT